MSKGRKARDMKRIDVTSGYGANSHCPFVEIKIDDFKTTMSTTKAREIAMYLLEAADAADSDAFIVEFFMKKIEVEIPEAILILREFREFRDQMRGKEASAA